MRALELLAKYRDHKSVTFPIKEDIPLRGVVKEDWHDLVLDNQESRKVHRIAYEMCVLSTLREKVRCKEIWVKGAGRYRNPDDDLPHDFEQKRAEYYACLEQPTEAKHFTEVLKARMEATLDALNRNLPTNPKIRIITSRKGKGQISVSSLEPVPEPQNITRLAAALVQRWPMTNLLDILKETELRVGLTDAFHSVATREMLNPDVLQRRLLLCLHGLGTNAGLKRMCSGGGEVSDADLQYVRRRYIQKDQLRHAIARVCNAIFHARKVHVWVRGQPLALRIARSSARGIKT